MAVSQPIMLYNIIISSYQRDNNRTNGRIGDAVMRRLRRGYAVRGYPSEQCSRNHNSPSPKVLSDTINTQQGMVISLRLFPFPTVLITIYRLRRIYREYAFKISVINDSSEKRALAFSAILLYSKGDSQATAILLANESTLPLRNKNPLPGSISSGMPPIRAPTTGVPNDNDSITLSGLFS